MAHEDLTSRDPSAVPCTYWNGEECTAKGRFAEEDISCYHDGNCNGFGTCRGCTQYNQGGMKIGQPDDESGITQTPINLLLYNVRAQLSKCCFWDGEVETFSKGVGTADAGNLSPMFTSPFPVVNYIPTGFPSGTAKQTKCTVTDAAPWQVAFTEDNPTAYGCNGAKPECPYYTGPEYTQVVDAKMDLGNRVTAKQILELRYHSADWKSFPDARAEWEKRFEVPDIWAWAVERTTFEDPLDPETPGRDVLPGKGKLDELGRPLVEKVSVINLTADFPEFSVSARGPVTTGTPTVGMPPSFPTLVRQLYAGNVGKLKVLWPKNTTPAEPFYRATWTEAERNIWIAASIDSDRASYAVNMTLGNRNQGNLSAEAYIARIKLEAPEDVISPTSTGLPGSTFKVPLVLNGTTDTVNHIRLFLDNADTEGNWEIADVHINHSFHHAHVAQTSFDDLYGHTVVDPWVNHFTNIRIGAKVMNLTPDVFVNNVLWNSISSNGSITMYAIEETKEKTSRGDNPLVDWQLLGCNHVEVTFNDPGINRVYPWAAWGTDSKGVSLSVKIDRSANTGLPSSEAKEIVLEPALSSTKGTAIPAYIAIFSIPTNLSFSPIDTSKDFLRVKYAYTDYKQGPIASEDVSKLKFPADVTNVIPHMVYDVDFSDTSITVGGTYVKLEGGRRLYSCEQILGDCYTKEAYDNEQNAQTVFFAGGIGETNLKSHSDMITTCKKDFEFEYRGNFEDGTAVSYTEAANRLAQINMLEGDQKYLVVFQDITGRPIGVKRPAFLMQSAVAQTRDVEVRYKWAGHSQYYPVVDPMFVLAIFYGPTYATRDRLTSRWLHLEYDPYCGDHTETTIGNAQYLPFDLIDSKHGALWYPYTRCFTPSYHNDGEIMPSPLRYEDGVEGFFEGKRRDYWERMRFWDQYMPAVMSYIPQVGCFWSERTATFNVNRPVVFTGYTKVRSLHPFGMYASDRESIRLSRHWEKRNLEVTAETISQEEGGYTLQLDTAFLSALLDDNGELNDGTETQTPVWVHINDGLSVVKPASEEIVHPFANLLLSRVGGSVFDETIKPERFRVKDVFIERDYTSTLDRSEDGTQIYLTNGTTLNLPAGQEDDFVKEQQGSDVRWAFKDDGIGWAWLPEPPAPERGSPRITGLFLSNPTRTLFKQNRDLATHTTEGPHILRYIPHGFDKTGAIVAGAQITMDNGPELYVSQTDGQLYIIEDGGSPYDAGEHEGEDYSFELHGPGTTISGVGLGVLADARGLQRYDIQGEKFATLAGINVNLTFDINELPYVIRDIGNINHLSGVADVVLDEDGNEITVPAPENQAVKVTAAVKEYEESDTGIVDISLNFYGHYYVEEVTIEFEVGPLYDIPAILIAGQLKVAGAATVAQASAQVTLAGPTSYQAGTNLEEDETSLKTFKINQRLFNLSLLLGARKSQRKMLIRSININLRDHEHRQETVFIYEPRLTVSSAEPGTHKPSDIEFYFQRSYPDHTKDYLSGQITVGDAISGGTALPGPEVKLLGRQIKDIIPQFEFTDVINTRFPYDNIDITQLTDQVTEQTPSGPISYLDSDINTSSKGWTLVTTRHYSDPGSSLISTDEGPFGIPNVFEGVRPVEDLQTRLYDEARALGGDKTAVYSGYWHPEEISYFAAAGIDLSLFSWTLQLRSTVASIDRVYRHEDYGCLPEVTNENLDGKVHTLSTWQARGVFHYACDARYSYACFTTTMNKCNAFFNSDYGTEAYLDNNVVDRFTYVFSFPPKDYLSYFAAGLINKNEKGGSLGSGSSISIFGSSPAQDLSDIYDAKHQSQLPLKGPGPYQ